MESTYILDTKLLINDNIALNYNRDMDTNQKINYLIQNLRYTINNQKNLSSITGATSLDYNLFPFRKKEYDIQNNSFKGEGQAIVDLLRRLNWDKTGITFEKYDISNLSNIVDSEQLKKKLGESKHSVSLVSIDDKKFIVDCAYKQFFSLLNNDNYGDINLKCAGMFMLRNEESRKVAEQILKYGFIEATPENLKTYMDGFILAAGNSEELQTPTIEEYEKKIKGQVQRDSGKVENEYGFSELWKLYSKKWFPDNSERLLNFGDNNSTIRNNLKRKLAFSDEKFQIITNGEKKYIRTKNGDIEFSLENLKAYLDHVIIQAACDKSDVSSAVIKKIEEQEKDFITPSIEEYLRLYPCAETSKMYSNFIVESEPYIDGDVLEDYNEQMSVEEKLMSIVQKERKYLMKSCDLIHESLAGECEDSSSRVILDCTSKGFKDTTYLAPNKYVGGEGHNCTIANLNGKSYLIDCTYRQFFVKGNFKDHCGIYMLDDKKRKEVAEQILKFGWIEATPENIKAYMDGYTMAERKSFDETGISADEYIEMLKNSEYNPINIISKGVEKPTKPLENVTHEDKIPIVYNIEESIINNASTELIGQEVISSSIIQKNNIKEIQNDGKLVENPEGHGEHN